MTTKRANNSFGSLKLQSINVPLIHMDIFPTAPLEIKQDMEVARQEFTKGNVSQASQIYDSCLKRYDGIDLMNDVGIILHSLGRSQDAVNLLLKVLEKNPKIDKIHYNIGTILYFFGEYRKSVNYLEQACSLLPDNLLYKNNLALSLMRCHQTEKAKELIENALLFINESTTKVVKGIVYNTLSLMLFVSGEVQQALEYSYQSKECFEEGNANSSVWNNIGCFLFALEEDEKGFAALKEAAKLSHGENDIALYNLGKIILYKDNPVFNVQKTESLDNSSVVI